MTEVWFYHLETQPLDAVLPALLQRSLDRGWKAAVQATSPERLAALDTVLWTFDDASFLPHGVKGEAQAERQPVLLTNDTANENGAAIRFFVDRASVASGLEGQGYQRAVLLFDGGDDEAVADARAQWVAVKAMGYPVTYWQQDDGGRWEKRA
jgi:DNA polymerase III subunit chi